MRHRAESDEYNWSRITISYRDEDWKHQTLFKGKGHVQGDDHPDYGNSIQVFLWDETGDRDDDGDLTGTYLTVRGTTIVFAREQAWWKGWLQADHFSTGANKLLKEAGLPIQQWTWVTVDASWWKETNDTSTT